MRWLKFHFFRSVSLKVSSAVLVCCLFACSVVAVVLFSHHQAESEKSSRHLVLNFTKEQQQIVASYFDSLVMQFDVLQNIFINLNKHPRQKQEIKLENISQDSAIRLRMGDVAYFSNAQNSQSFQLSNTLLNAGQLLSSVYPQALEEFSAVYFIDTQGGSAMLPYTVIDNTPEDFRPESYPLYYLGTPENNPTGQSVWTPPYYDSTQNVWLVTLVVPVYQDGEFIGTLGGDVNLNLLDEILSDHLVLHDNRNILIFSETGSLLASSHSWVDSAAQTKPKMGEKLENQFRLPAYLQDYFKRAIDSAELKSGAPYYQQEPEPFGMVSFDALNWYIAVLEKPSDPNSEIPHMVEDAVWLILLVSLILACVVFGLLKFCIFNRINLLSKMLREHHLGHVDVSQFKQSADEISQLATAFEHMSSDLGDLIDGLNQKIEEKERAERAALRLSNAIRYSETAIAITDEDFLIEFVNPKFVEITGIEEADLYGKTLTSVIDEQMQWVMEAALVQLQAGQAWKGELVFQHANGDSIWVSQTFSPMVDNDTEQLHYISATQDISMMKKSQRKMEKLAYHDPLTQLHNRTYFKSQLVKSLEMAKRGHFTFALIYFDLDDFKRINDTLGHDAGDKLLVEIGKRLRLRLRAEDTIARLGGDEFAIILSSASNLHSAGLMAEQIQDVINAPFQLDGAEVLVGASIGITMSPQDTTDMDVLLRNADLAMYRAKSSGRRNYQFFTSELDKALKESILIENELKIALKEDQFELWYQPQFVLESGELHGFEALIRWQHPRRGLVLPMDFIPIAEQSGLIVEIGEWVIAQACRFIHRINQTYQKEFTVSLNLSARQFKDKNIVSVIRDSLKAADANAKWLDFELTESMLMGSLEESIKQMNDIKSLGAKISIDDFGTGYSSLSYLKKFPVDTLKVDRTFIRDIPFDTDDMAISDAIIALGHSLHLQVVAEGIENQQHVDFLKAKQCEIGQGYMYSPALKEADLCAYIDSLAD